MFGSFTGASAVDVLLTHPGHQLHLVVHRQTNTMPIKNVGMKLVIGPGSETSPNHPSWNIATNSQSVGA